MERIEPKAEKDIILKEHHHRYEMAARLATGRVLDAACGAGYGSQQLLASPRVESYLGLDQTDVAAAAKLRFGSARADFRGVDLENVAPSLGRFETIVTMETLEHLKRPEAALGSWKQLLMPGGLLLGSVPTKAYEELCEKVYGENPYHIQRFDLARLRDLLRANFAHFAIFTAAIDLGTAFRFVESTLGSAPSAARDFSFGEPPHLGSFYFIASDDEARILTCEPLVDSRLVFFRAQNMVEFEGDVALPLRETIRDQAVLVDERDAYIRRLEQRVNEAEKERREVTELWDQKQTRLQELEVEIEACRLRVADLEKMTSAQAHEIHRMKEWWGCKQLLRRFVGRT